MASGSRMVGDVPEAVTVMWHNRQVMNFSFGLGRKAQKWGRCDENLKSFAHMAVSNLVGCSFCLDLGYFQAHNAGLDVAKAREVPRWRESDVFTSLERDVMEYAEAMTQTPPPGGVRRGMAAGAAAHQPGRGRGCRARRERLDRDAYRA